MPDPVTLTPEILAMLDIHEPDKVKHAKLLTEHLARQRIMPSREGELQQHLERKAKRGLDIQLIAKEAEALRQEQARQAAAAQHAQNRGFIATFAERAREAAIAARATREIAKVSTSAAATEAEAAIADAMAKQE
jgi:D-Tyr-tRNAtyr deacylase